MTKYKQKRSVSNCYSKIYQCCFRAVHLYCSEIWEFTVADELRLHRVGWVMIRIVCGVRMIDWASSNVLRERVVGVVVNLK